MTSKVNQRIKRKNEFSDKIEPNMKALKKEDLIARITALQASYNTLEKKSRSLEDENKTHLEAIHLLEETVRVLETKLNRNIVEKMTKEVQTGTFASKEVYLCEDCDYAADCIHDFNDHTHSPDGFENLDNSIFTCNFCEQSFKTLPEVMRHNKIIHTSKVKPCKQFLEHVCFYGENCWFLHNETLKKCEPNFKCNYCENRFRTHNGLREHMKSLHIQFVANCNNEVDCNFGSRKCWFVHKEDIETAYKNAKDDGQNNDIIHDID